MKQISAPTIDTMELQLLEIIDGTQYVCEKCRAGFRLDKKDLKEMNVLQDHRLSVPRIHNEGSETYTYDIKVATPKCPNCGEKTMLAFNTQSDGGCRMVYSSSQGAI